MRNNTKIMLFSISVILIIILSGFSIKSYLQKNTDRLQSEITVVKKSIDKRDWTTANKKINNLSQDWNHIEGIWALFINHHEIDNITSSLRKVVQYIHYNNIEDSAAYLSELEEYIKHIPDMEKISLRNIL